MRDLLLRCLASLAETEAEIIVVDNASTDGSLAALREAFPDAKVVANAENVGFARAVNQGVAVASGDFVLLLNPDTDPQPAALRALLDVLQRDPTCGIVAPSLLNEDGTLQSAGRPFPSALRILRNRLLPFRGRRLRPAAAQGSPTPVECEWVVGACLMVRQEVLDQIGGLDEGYFLYGEDRDLCYRARQAGWRVLCLPQVTVVHYAHQSARQRLVEAQEAFIDGQFRYLRKFCPPHYGWLFGVAGYLSYRARQAACWLLARLRPQERAKWSGKSAVLAAGAARCATHLAERRPDLEEIDRGART